MNKYWFVWLYGEQKGPYSYEELKEIPAITPDTLVWKEGMTEWTPIRNVPELKKLFQDENNFSQEESDEVSIPLPQDEIALPLNNAEPPLLLWVFIALVVLSYVLFRLSQ